MRSIPLFVALSFFSLCGCAQTPEQGSAAETNPQMPQMQSRMQAMRAQMERIHATEDPAERQRLMQEHMQAMHQGMMMMGQMMDGGMPQGQARQCRQDDAECRMDQMQTQQRMMGQRMGMMQQMMEQMMEQMMQGQSTEEQATEGGQTESHEQHH